MAAAGGLAQARADAAADALALGSPRAYPLTVGGDSRAAIVDEVRALRDDVRNLKVYLDTGALVGGISRQMDGSLGRRQLMAGRGVV